MTSGPSEEQPLSQKPTLRHLDDDKQNLTQDRQYSKLFIAKMLIEEECARTRQTKQTRQLVHDFSNVMTGLTSYAESCMEDFDGDEEQQRSLSIICENAFKARDFVHEMMKVNETLNNESVQIINCLDWLKDNRWLLLAMQDNAEGRVLSFADTRPDDGTGTLPLIKVDIAAFKAVLLNLSLEFSSRLQFTSGELNISVRDMLLKGKEKKSSVVIEVAANFAHKLNEIDCITEIPPAYRKDTFAINPGLERVRHFAVTHHGRLAFGGETDDNKQRLWLCLPLAPA